MNINWDHKSRIAWAYVLGAIFLVVSFRSGLVIFFAGDDFDWLFDALQFLYRPTSLLKLQGNFVRPTETLFFFTNLLIGGGSPIAHHAAAIGIHVLNTLLLSELIRHLSQDRIAGVVGALFWGLNYKHVETILLVHAISDAIVLFCWLAAFLLFFSRRRLLALMCFLISLFSKENAIFFPALVTLYIWLFLPAERKPWLRRALPLWIATVGFLGFRQIVTAGDTSYLGIDWNALSQFWENVLSLIGPDSFAIKEYWLDGWAYLFPRWVAIILFVFSAIVMVKVSNLYRFAMLWTALTMLPTTFIAVQTARYRYIPMVGAAVAVAGISRSVRRYASAHPRIVQPVLGFFCLVLLIYFLLGINLEASDYRFFGEMHRQAAASFEQTIIPAMPKDDAAMAVFLKQDNIVWAERLFTQYTRPWYLPGTYKVVFRRPNGVLGLSSTMGFVSYCAYRQGVQKLFVSVPYEDYQVRMRAGKFYIILHNSATNTFSFGPEALKPELMKQVDDYNFYTYLQPGRFDSTAMGVSYYEELTTKKHKK